MFEPINKNIHRSERHFEKPVYAQNAKEIICVKLLLFSVTPIRR